MAWVQASSLCHGKRPARLSSERKRDRDHQKAYVAIDHHSAAVQRSMDRQWDRYMDLADRKRRSFPLSFRAEEKLDRPAAAPQSSICGRCRETSIDIHCKRKMMKMMAAAHWIVIANDRFTGIEMSSEAMETVSIRNRSS